MYNERALKRVNDDKETMTELDKKALTAIKRTKSISKGKASTCSDIINDIAKDYEARSGKEIGKDFILNNKEQQMVLTQIILGIKLDPLTNKEAGMSDKLKAIDLLSKLQSGEVDANVTENHNESIKTLELVNSGEAPNRKIEDFE